MLCCASKGRPGVSSAALHEVWTNLSSSQTFSISAPVAAFIHAATRPNQGTALAALTMDKLMQYERENFYHPLTGLHTFRLLILSPGHIYDPVSIRLLVATQSTAPAYSA